MRRIFQEVRACESAATRGACCVSCVKFTVNLMRCTLLPSKISEEKVFRG